MQGSELPLPYPASLWRVLGARVRAMAQRARHACRNALRPLAAWPARIGIALALLGLLVGLPGLARGQAAAVAYLPPAPAPTAPAAAPMAEAPALSLDEQVRAFSAQAAAALARQARIDIQIGQLDPRLRLAACQRIEPYLPQGQRLWGKSRVGLRCLQGSTRWNVYLPVTVRVFAPAVVAAAPLPAGKVLQAADVTVAEIDVTVGTTHRDGAALIGRQMRSPLAAGQAVIDEALHERRWFEAGDTVTLVAVGEGYAVSSEGQALAPGLEGRSVRIRTESGRIVSARAVAPRRAEVRL